jgi:amidohydrolase
MSEEWRQQLDAAIEQIADRMVEVRRHLHRHPEVSGEERETSLYLYQALGDEGFAVRMGPEGRGVVIDSSRDWQEEGESIIALRADIDALRIHDAKKVDYRSQCDGVMHACGHDAHTAIAFGALIGLKTITSAGQLPCPLLFRGIFQPAEETCQGAQEMIAVGALERVDSILAVHMDPTRDVGSIGVRTGVLTANCDEMRITISGLGGHAARPHETSDPITAAAQLINAMYLHIPRATDSQDAVVVTFGQISAGENANVIPEEAVLRGTVRTLDRTIRRQTMEHVCRLAEGVGQTTETRIEVHFGLASDSVDNDPDLMRMIRRAGEDILGRHGLQEILRPSMGSEDFAFYLKHVPGAMLRLGSGSDRQGRSPLHTPAFDIDELALTIGAKILARAAVYRALDQANAVENE